jgi:glutamate-ammonia-ligase adenylyltransferase
MRLRPSGRQGLLVSSLESFCRYHADPLPVWERLAMLRVRPAAEARFGGNANGNPEDSALPLGRLVTDDVLARSLFEPDPTHAPSRDEIVREVRRLRDRVQRELARESREDAKGGRAARYNAKSGVGGCLELELLVSALQLMHAPRHRAIAVRGIVPGLTRLEEAGILRDEEVSELSAAYRFLRLLLNRLRMSHGAGTDDPDRFAANSPTLVALARRMGLPENEALLRKYLETRSIVRRAFDRHLS